MPNDCLPHVQVCRIRVARLDSNGVPSPGAGNLYVSDKMQAISVTPVYVDGTEISEKNGCGAEMVSFNGPPTLKRWDFQLVLLTPDPELIEMLVGGTVLTSGNRTGWGSPALGPVSSNGVSIEWWVYRANDGDADATYPHARWVAPKIKNLKLGAHEFGEARAVMPTITGQCFENPNWYNGPANDWNVASDKAVMWLPDTVMPTAVCGYQALAAS